MPHPWLHLPASLVVLIAIFSNAHAAESPAQAHSCSTVVDPADRLACYDAAFPPSAETRTEVEARRLKALQDFGLRNAQLHANEPERAREVAPDQIEAAVVTVDMNAQSQRVVRLDNGQAWVLTQVTSKGQLRSGDRVVIRGAALGSFMLVTPARISLRARRLQ